VTTRSACRFLRSSFLRASSWVIFGALLLFIFSTVGTRPPQANAAAASRKLKPTDPYALIFGTVWGPDDHPVYGVKVVIRRATGKKDKWNLYSDHRGEFAQRVAAGKNDYIVGADLKSVKTKEGQPLHLVEEVPVHVEYDERVDIGLHLTR
jgi:hypothetical protein